MVGGLRVEDSGPNVRLQAPQPSTLVLRMGSFMVDFSGPNAGVRTAEMGATRFAWH
jgi:hypothetical protein